MSKQTFLKNCYLYKLTVMKTDDTVHKLHSKRTTPSADIKSKRA